LSTRSAASPSTRSTESWEAIRSVDGGDDQERVSDGVSKIPLISCFFIGYLHLADGDTDLTFPLGALAWSGSWTEATELAPGDGGG